MRTLIACAALLLLCGCVAGGYVEDPDLLWQTATIDSLLAGVYDGAVTMDDLLVHGDFGLGTFDHLDGEMVVLDGAVWQVPASGRPRRVPRTLQTPFAAVTFFEPNRSFKIKDVPDLAALKATLKRQLRSPNLFYAIRIRGEFNAVVTRSVPAQKPPYPPLAEAVKDQKVFRIGRTKGTLVILWCPPYVKGINVPGAHVHFLAADRGSGGHVLDVAVCNAMVEIDETWRFQMEVPVTGDFHRVGLSAERGDELRHVETAPDAAKGKGE